MRAIVFGRTTPPCSYCISAKALLESKEIPFFYVDVGTDISIEQLKVLVPQAQSVPQIYIDDVYVGGFSQLQRMFS